jgi:uncharacterized protein YutE (UPF0331/DUF86 family)
MTDVKNHVLSRLFTDFDEALGKLKRLAEHSHREFLEHYEKIDSAKYNFIVTIESLIDICNRIIAKQKLGFPEDYADVVRLMKGKGVIEETLAQRLIQMVKFRNMLVHVYWKIENDKVYQYLTENLEDFESFKRAIRAYLAKHS